MDKDELAILNEAYQALGSEVLANDTLICECFCVSVQDIKVSCSGTLNLNLLKDEFGFGEGCGKCIKEMDSWSPKIFGEIDVIQGGENGL